MAAKLKKFLAIVSLFVSSLMFVTPAFAAAPDGNGPWADNVVSTAQGMQKNGSPVQVVRSDPTSALGVAEQTNADGSFYSLGFGGSMTLGFDNGISGGSMVFESTNLPYPIETAKVEFSSNGSTWVTAGTVGRTGTVNQPAGVSCAKFVRITDTSDKAQYEATADGYDVDGVQALGNPCQPPVTDCGCCGGNISLQNKAVIINNVHTTSNTGGNVIAGVTASGSAIITTSPSSATSIVNNTVNTNNVTGSGCCNCNNCNGTVSDSGVGARALTLKKPATPAVNHLAIKPKK